MYAIDLGNWFAANSLDDFVINIFSFLLSPCCSTPFFSFSFHHCPLLLSLLAPIITVPSQLAKNKQHLSPTVADIFEKLPLVVVRTEAAAERGSDRGSNAGDQR
ncbi:hypothetical protein VTI74DRAFT_8036 [Chaetomium olivicolor]